MTALFLHRRSLISKPGKIVFNYFEMGPRFAASTWSKRDQFVEPFFFSNYFKIIWGSQLYCKNIVQIFFISALK